VRPCEPQVPTPAEIKAPDPLRQATLHPCPQRILGFELRRLLALPRGLERLVVGLQPDGELAGRRMRRGTRLAGRARTTGSAVKPEANHRIARHIASRPPVDTGMALGTVRQPRRQSR
jgi:hypothetical protein